MSKEVQPLHKRPPPPPPLQVLVKQQTLTSPPGSTVSSAGGVAPAAPREQSQFSLLEQVAVLAAGRLTLQPAYGEHILPNGENGAPPA